MFASFIASPSVVPWVIMGFFVSGENSVTSSTYDIIDYGGLFKPRMDWIVNRSNVPVDLSGTLKLSNRPLHFDNLCILIV